MYNLPRHVGSLRLTGGHGWANQWQVAGQELCQLVFLAKNGANDFSGVGIMRKSRPPFVFHSVCAVQVRPDDWPVALESRLHLHRLLPDNALLLPFFELRL
jgi:hypothetical protein